MAGFRDAEERNSVFQVRLCNEHQGDLRIRLNWLPAGLSRNKKEGSNAAEE
jgi:hypothetical protein